MDAFAPPARHARVRVEWRGEHHQLVAAAAFEPGDPVLAFAGVVMAEPTRFSVQLDGQRHLAPAGALDEKRLREACPWVFLNHSCAPNAIRQGRILLAAKSIAPGEEITFDYEASEEDMRLPFRCRCGAACCTGRWVRGFKHLTRGERERRLPFLTAYLRRRHEANAYGGVPEDSA